MAALTTRLAAVADRTPALRRTAVFALHVVAFAGCHLLAYALRFELDLPADIRRAMLVTLPFVVAVQLLAGALFGFYRGWWRYVGISDLVRLACGLGLATAVELVLWQLAQALDWPAGSRGALLIGAALALLALGGARVLVRLARDRWRDEPAVPSAVRRALIIGAGDAGEALAREIEHRPQLGLRVAGFVDDHPAKIGCAIRGVRIHGPIADLAAIAARLRAHEALIAMPSAPGERIREVVALLAAAGVPCRTMPGVDQLVAGRVTIAQLRPVVVEDLLRRAPVELPGDGVLRLVRGRRVLIAGAGGTIGSQLALQAARLGAAHLALVDRSELALYEVDKRLARDPAAATVARSCHLADVGDGAVMAELFDLQRPHVVLHAAAHKHVPLGELNVREYLRNNCLATRSLAEGALRAGVERFVLISTDKAIRPSSVMGATKRAAEIALLDLAREGRMSVTIVRFGNVIGSSGSVVPLFLEQIAAGGPVTVTHPEARRYFLRTSEAVSLVLQAAALGDHGEVFMLAMGEPVRILDLARDLIRLSTHREGDIPIDFIGLRPGEKLCEELRLAGEHVRPTRHPQIVVTRAEQPERAVVAEWLHNARRAGDDATARRLLARLVPELPDEAAEGAPPLPVATHHHLPVAAATL